MPASTRRVPAPWLSEIRRYRTVKGILVAGTEHGDDPLPQVSAPPALLRGPAAFDTERTT